MLHCWDHVDAFLHHELTLDHEPPGGSWVDVDAYLSLIAEPNTSDESDSNCSTSPPSARKPQFSIFQTAAVMPGCVETLNCLLQVTFPLVLDTYEFCSDELKKQLDGPRVAVREEEDRKANKDRAVKKAKMVCTLHCDPSSACNTRILYDVAQHCVRYQDPAQ